MARLNEGLAGLRLLHGCEHRNLFLPVFLNIRTGQRGGHCFWIYLQDKGVVNISHFDVLLVFLL